MPHDQHSLSATFSAAALADAVAAATLYARRRAPTHADADDAVQRAVKVAVAKPQRFDPARGTLVAWIVTLTRDALRSAKRDRGRHPTEPLDEAASNPAAGPRDVLALGRLDGALASLDPLDRALIEGRVIEERSWAELASSLARPAHVLQHRLGKALASLRAACLRAGLRPSCGSDLATSIPSEKSLRGGQRE